jgi:hypothetical protein
MGIDEFVERIRAELASRGVDRYVSVSLRGDDLAVALSYMGTTKFDYRVESGVAGFRAELIRQRVSPFHAVFRDRFEGYFEEALDKVGSKVV